MTALDRLQHNGEGPPPRGAATLCIRWAAAAALAVAAALAAPPSLAAGKDDAQARITARKLGADAVKLYDTGYYAAALEKFEAASSLVPAPTLSLYAARCLVKLGRLVEASERYLTATRMQLEKGAPAVMKKAQAEAQTERDALVPTIPLLKIEVSGPPGKGINVLLDGKDVPPAMLGEKVPLDPGKHKVQVMRADTTVEREVTLAPKDSTDVLLTLPPMPPPPAPITPPLRLAGFAASGVGALGLLTFAASGVAAVALSGSLTGDPLCKDNVCDPALSGKVDAYQATRILTTVGLVVGVVGAGVGVPLILLNPVQRPKEAHITPWIGVASAGLRGSF